jgi:hypothetical protein
VVATGNESNESNRGQTFWRKWEMQARVLIVEEHHPEPLWSHYIQSKISKQVFFDARSAACRRCNHSMNSPPQLEANQFVYLLLNRVK